MMMSPPMTISSPSITATFVPPRRPDRFAGRALGHRLDEITEGLRREIQDVRERGVEQPALEAAPERALL
jgi:hypothetical protein